MAIKNKSVLPAPLVRRQLASEKSTVTSMSSKISNLLLATLFASSAKLIGTTHSELMVNAMAGISFFKSGRASQLQ